MRCVSPSSSVAQAYTTAFPMSWDAPAQKPILFLHTGLGILEWEPDGCHGVQQHRALSPARAADVQRSWREQRWR